MSDPVNNFEGAHYYDDDGAETLSHSSPEEYLDELAKNGGLRYPCTKAEFLAYFDGGIDVFAYRRKILDVKDVEGSVRTGVDALLESMQEEYGPMDEPWLDTKEEEALVQAILPIALAELQKKTVWQCDTTGRRTYTPQEIYDIVAADGDGLFKEES